MSLCDFQEISFDVSRGTFLSFELKVGLILFYVSRGTISVLVLSGSSLAFISIKNVKYLVIIGLDPIIYAHIFRDYRIKYSNDIE